MISPQRMAETIHRSVLAEISTKRAHIAATPLPLLNGLERSPAIIADNWVDGIARQLQAAKHHRAYDESTIRAHAENYATLCSRMGSLESRQSFALHIGVEPPAGKTVTREGAAARLDDPMWWRRQLRKVWTRASEDALREIGIVRKGKQPYASDAAVEHRRGRQIRTQEWMESRVMVNGEGEQLALLDLHKRSLANPALRRGEFMTRMRGFEEIAQDLGHVALFWTLTAPSAFHAHHSGGGVNAAWELAERPRVKDAQQWLCKMWARARAKLARLSILFYGFRVAEPHHDATPHWHMVLFVAPASAELLRLVLQAVWLSDYANERGAEEFRSKCITIENDKGSATGYVAKYVAKNIDAAGEIGDAISDETGTKVSESVARVAAWAACHGIRQFQQVGGPPVGLWRECRRVREAVTDADIERARAAADRGDWRAFIYALNWRGIKAGRRDLTVQIAREDDTATHYRKEPPQVGPRELDAITGERIAWEENGYGEVKAPRIIGLRACSRVVVTRIHRWRIEKKCSTTASAAADGSSATRPATSREKSAYAPGIIGVQGGGDACSDSLLALGSRSDLGPVAITVRDDPQGPDLSAGLDFSWVMTVPFKVGASFGDPAAWTSRETSMAGPH